MGQPCDEGTTEAAVVLQVGGIRSISWSRRHRGGKSVLHHDHVPKWVGVRYRLRLRECSDDGCQYGDSATRMGLREASDRRTDRAILVGESVPAYAEYVGRRCSAMDSARSSRSSHVHPLAPRPKVPARSLSAMRLQSNGQRDRRVLGVSLILRRALLGSGH